MEKSLNKIQTLKGLNFIGKRGKYNQKHITLDDIMSILLYCNCDDLQRKFRGTFYWWRKLLNQTIYCFGDDIGTYSITVYHGLSKKLLLTQFEECFYSPLMINNNGIKCCCYISM